MIALSGARLAMAGAVAAAVLGSTSASADILAVAARDNLQRGLTDSPQQVLLKDNDARALRFTTSARNTRVSVTFNATCRVSGEDPVVTVVIEIRVDNELVLPFSFGLCGKDAEDGFSSPSVGAVAQGVLTVRRPGEHVARVFARLSSPPVNPGVQWTFVENSLVVAK